MRWQIQKHPHTTSVATKSPELMNLFLWGRKQEQILSFSPLTFTYSNYPLSSTSVGCLLLHTWFILNHISPHTLHPCTQLHRSIMAFYRFSCLSSYFFVFFIYFFALHSALQWKVVKKSCCTRRRGRAIFSQPGHWGCLCLCVCVKVNLFACGYRYRVMWNMCFIH